MADEIAQVLAMEVDGVKLVFKATLEVAEFLARALRSLIRSSQKKMAERKEKKADNDLHSAGEKSIGDIFKLSEGNPPQALDIREVDFDAVIKLATDKGLHFAKTIDFTPNDGLKPIMIPAQEAIVWSQIYKSVSGKRLEEDRKIVSGYDKHIQEEMEKLLNCKSDEEREQTETKIENLQQAKSEASKWVDYGEDVASKDDATMTIQDYIRQSEGTDFEKSPEIATAEYEKGVEIGAKIGAKESLQPIRDKNYIPKSNYMFYVPETGSIITRSFGIDQDTGVAYSKYALKTQNGEVYSCSDKDMTKDKWNRIELPKLMDKAGILEETECRAFNTEEKLKAYLEYHGKIKSPAQENVEKHLQEGKEVFHSAEAKHEIMNAVSEQNKGFASATVRNEDVELVCDPKMLTRENGRLCMRLSDDESITFSKIFGEGMTNNGMAKFCINNDSDVTFVKKTDRATTQISITTKEAQEKIKEVLGEQAGITKDNSITHNKPMGRR